MSLRNGEKARAAVTNKRRIAQRAKARVLRAAAAGTAKDAGKKTDEKSSK